MPRFVKACDYLAYYPANFTLREICNALATVKYKWFSIGIQLRVPYHKLKEFENEANPLEETVNYFRKGNVEGVPLSWDSIATALKSDHVGEPALAKHLQNVYTQQGHEPQQGAAEGMLICVLVRISKFCVLGLGTSCSQSAAATDGSSTVASSGILVCYLIPIVPIVYTIIYRE